MAKAKKKTICTIPQKRTPVREQDPKQRVKNFGEVNCGYTLSEALNEAERRPYALIPHVSPVAQLA